MLGDMTFQEFMSSLGGMGFDMNAAGVRKLVVSVCHDAILPSFFFEGRHEGNSPKVG